LLIKSSPEPDYGEVPVIGTDTLLFADEVHLVFNMRSIFQKAYELKKIELKDATILLYRDKKGMANYTIFRSSPGDNLSGSFSVNLKKIDLVNVNISFFDSKTGLWFSGKTDKGDLSGSFTEEDFHITAKTKLSRSGIRIRSENYFNNRSFILNFQLGKEKSSYEFNNGFITYSGIDLHFSGKYNAQNKYYSFSMSSRDTPLPRIDIPVLNDYFNKYQARFENGSINIKSTISGHAGKISPAITVNYKIVKGVIRYKENKLKITDVYSKGSYSNGTGRNSKSSVFIVDTVFARSGKSNLSFSGDIRNFSAPVISGNMEIRLEPEKISGFMEMPGNYSISGFVTGRIQFTLFTSKENILKSVNWNKSLFKGNVTLHEVSLEQPQNNLPVSLIAGKLQILTADKVVLDNILVKTGRSDFLVNGSIDHLPLITQNKTVFPVFSCEVLSNHFNTGDFLTLKSDHKKEPVKIAFPDSVSVNAKFRAEEFHSGKFKASDVEGFVQYHPKMLTIEHFSMASLNGSISSTLSLKEENNSIVAWCDAGLDKVDIGDLFYTFNNFRQDVIQNENLDGSLSGHGQFTTAWDLNLNLIPKKISLTSQISITNGELINYQPLLGLSDYIKVDELKHIKFETLNTSVSIRNKKVYISETDIHSSAISLKGSGEHGFNKKYTYRLQVHLSDVLWKKAKRRNPANTEFGYIVDDGYGKTMIPLIITGNETSYEVHYDKTTARSILKNKVRKEKELLKELFSHEEEKSEPIPARDSVRIEWENSENNEAPDAHQQDEEPDDDQEFRIEWEDE
jgi:hypothetical protein